MDIWFSAIIALFLPWLTGSAWTYWLLSRNNNWHPAAVIGHGYLLGIFATTLIMRGFQVAGFQQSFLGTSLWLTALALAATALIYVKPGQSRYRLPEPRLPGWQKAVIGLLLMLIAVRYTTILQELILRPLFPWDAWMNWAPKAVIWFHYKEFVPFVSQAEWLVAPADALNHLEGAKNAWKYPISVPLVQLWGILGLGTDDHTGIYLPWLAIAVTLGLLMFGHLKLAGSSTLLAVAAAYAILSMPFVNVHSALAGYADLWVAVAFGASVFSLGEWNRTRQWPYGLLALIMAAFCSTLKVPGVVMGGIVLLAFLTCYYPIGLRAYSAVGMLFTAMFLFVYFIGIKANIPSVGSIELTRDLIAMPYLGEFDIIYHNVSAAMSDTLFQMINWNLFWCIFFSSMAIAFLKPKIFSPLRTETTAFAATLVMLIFVYFFTERYRFVIDYTQFNRALLYAIPVGIYLLANMLSNASVDRNTASDHAQLDQ